MPGSFSSGARYLPTERLLFRSWPDDSIVVCYDTLSGDTHLLSEMAALALQQLQQDNGLQLDALLARVAASLGMETNPELASAIEQILNDFNERGMLVHA